MTQTIAAHYDGRVIVPDEPVELIAQQSIRVTIHATPPPSAWTPERIEAQKLAIDRLLAMPKSAANPSDNALRRESHYED